MERRYAASYRRDASYSTSDAETGEWTAHSHTDATNSLARTTRTFTAPDGSIVTEVTAMCLANMIHVRSI